MNPAAGSPLDSTYSWFRLSISLLLSTMGGAGMWSVVVILPAVQAEFGANRGDTSLAYTATMLGFAAGGVVTGWLSDRYGTMRPLFLGGIFVVVGYALAGYAPNLVVFALAQGVFIAMLGSAATFGPLMADVSRWFVRRRGIAVSLCATGNYFAGVVWPPLLRPFIESYGWRPAYVGLGLGCGLAMMGLSLFLRRPAPADTPAGVAGSIPAGRRAIDLPLGRLQTLLVVAGVACCVAMAMPQAHLVAYCTDLGYGLAAGSEMLALMFATGIVSRLGAGLLADRFGGLATLLLGSFLQMAALGLYLFFDSLTSLFVITAVFGLVQGGIVPSYAIVVRENFPASEAGTRVGIVIMSTLVGMALGGWISGAIFDATGSYAAAFLNGVAWNAVNVAIVLWLLGRPRPATLAA
jgi:MFS family permease